MKEIWHTHQGKIGFLVFEKVVLAAFLKDKLLVKNLREEVKNGALTKTKGLCIQNLELIIKKLHCRYLEKYVFSAEYIYKIHYC